MMAYHDSVMGLQSETTSDYFRFIEAITPPIKAVINIISVICLDLDVVVGDSAFFSANAL